MGPSLSPKRRGKILFVSLAPAGRGRGPSEAWEGEGDQISYRITPAHPCASALPISILSTGPWEPDHNCTRRRVLVRPLRTIIELLTRLDDDSYQRPDVLTCLAPQFVIPAKAGTHRSTIENISVLHSCAMGSGFRRNDGDGEVCESIHAPIGITHGHRIHNA